MLANPDVKVSSGPGTDMYNNPLLLRGCDFFEDEKENEHTLTHGKKRRAEAQTWYNFILVDGMD
jgi:hypothetical protein